MNSIDWTDDVSGWATTMVMSSTVCRWDPGMIFGMYLIIAGVIAAGYGLLPSKAAYNALVSSRVPVVAPEDAPLSRAHWTLMAVLVVALIIDVMKPATLGFTIPGMVREYQTTKQHASLVPFSALIGTASGSILWGVLADFYGRKAAILLSAVPPATRLPRGRRHPQIRVFR
jgi:putative MFS transporter